MALCVALYVLGCRLMPIRFAFWGALAVALAAPHSHLGHLLFGYRYLVFSVLALLAFGWRLQDRDPRVVARRMLLSGGLAGVNAAPAVIRGEASLRPGVWRAGLDATSRWIAQSSAWLVF